MALADDLRGYPAAEEPDYEPGASVEFDGGRGVIDTGAIRGDVPRDFTPIFRDCLISAGHDPDKVRIGRMLKESHWQQRARKRVWSDQHNAYIQHHEFETVWLHCFKFETILEDAPPATDLDALVRNAQGWPRPGGGAHWFVFQAGDQQLGKRSRDGSTEEIVDRYVASVEAAKREFHALSRHGIAGIQISMPGDCIEGNQSQKGQNLWLTKETVTEQTRILRRLMMYTVEQFAPLVDQVYLDVVGGNHDDAQRIQNTYPGNNWATESAIAVADALKLNSRTFGHVEVRVPEQWSGFMTVPVGDSIVTVIHGHQWTRSTGPMKWLSEQAVNHQPAGGTQIVQHGHWHELQIRSNAYKIAIGSPTYDAGSDWYRNMHGGTSLRGGLVYLLRGGALSRMTLV
ncbi:MAG: hypothetical protein CK431_16985 [Mycobacterium sp.]|nr:MAG: hypothetical protein CK431_16985 [Mycobacterium sp.]